MNEKKKYHTTDKTVNAKRIILKIGSSTLSHTTGRLNIRRIETLVKVTADFYNSGREMIIVSSGAVSAGVAKLGLRSPLSKLADKKAAAAVGQAELMNIYERFFLPFGIKIAQLLFTRDVVDNEVRRANAVETLETLIKMGCIPIVNENDPVSSDELKFSGNDVLSSYVCMLTSADLVINLTDIDGLFDRNPMQHPDARLITYVDRVTDEVMAYAGGAVTDRGTGGMLTKLQAARMIEATKVPMIITNGKNPEILYDIMEGKVKGTYIANI